MLKQNVFKQNISAEIQVSKQDESCWELQPETHYHDHIEIVFFSVGKYTVSVSGESFEAQAGDMVVINALLPHNIRCVSNFSKSCSYTLHFMPSVFYASSELKYLQSFLCKKYSSEISVSEIHSLIKNAYDDFVNKEYGYEFSVKSYLYRVLFLLLKSREDSGIYPKSNNRQLMEKIQLVTSYVEENFSEQITSENMADMAHMSYSYFSRVFTGMMGQTFSKYLNNKRISEAKKLLHTTDMTVTEIAVETGFSTSSYFIKQFKKSNNDISPSKFRKNILKI